MPTSPSEDGAAASMTATAKQRFCTAVGPNDILLGRGAPIINNEGNKRFRELVTKRKKRYLASSRHQEKNIIADEIIGILAERDAKFLKKVEDKEVLEKAGFRHDADVWEEVDDSTVIQKVKQALRESASRYQGAVQVAINSSSESNIEDSSRSQASSVTGGHHHHP
jgi:hypothetical protein